MPGLSTVRAAWEALEAWATSPFATWAWAHAWQRHIGDGRELHLLAGRRADGAIAAIVPLVAGRRGPFRVLRQVGYGPADELGPLCAPEDRAAVVRALDRWLADRPRPTVLLLERLPGEAGWGRLLGRAPVRRAASPVLPARGRSFDELLAERSRNLRDQVRRRERRLRRSFRVRYRLTDDTARLRHDLSVLIGLHRLVWGDRSRAFDSPLDRFHLAFAEEALARGWLRLWTLELDGRPAAAWYGLRHRGVEWYYQAGRDPALDSHAVGFVLLCHTIRAALEDGVDAYRFGLGDESYKYRFAEDDPGTETFGVAGTAGGRVAVGAMRAALMAPGPVRRLLGEAIE